MGARNTQLLPPGDDIDQAISEIRQRFHLERVSLTITYLISPILTLEQCHCNVLYSIINIEIEWLEWTFKSRFCFACNGGHIECTHECFTQMIRV